MRVLVPQEGHVAVPVGYDTRRGGALARNCIPPLVVVAAPDVHGLPDRRRVHDLDVWHGDSVHVSERRGVAEEVDLDGHRAVKRGAEVPADRVHPSVLVVHVGERVEPVLAAHDRADLRNAARRLLYYVLAVLRDERDRADAPLYRPVVELGRVVRFDRVRKVVHAQVDLLLGPDPGADVFRDAAPLAVVRRHAQHRARVVCVPRDAVDKVVVEPVVLDERPARGPPGLHNKSLVWHGFYQRPNLGQNVRHVILLKLCAFLIKNRTSLF